MNKDKVMINFRVFTHVEGNDVWDKVGTVNTYYSVILLVVNYSLSVSQVM